MNSKYSVSILKIVKQCFDIYTLKQCPVCKENFDEIRQNIEPSGIANNNPIRQTKAENLLHMVKHFSKELCTHLSTKRGECPFMCLLVSLRKNGVIKQDRKRYLFTMNYR